MSTVRAVSAGNVAVHAVARHDAATVARPLPPEMICASSADETGRNPDPCTTTFAAFPARPEPGDTVGTFTVLAVVALWWHSSWVSPVRNVNHSPCPLP